MEKKDYFFNGNLKIDQSLDWTVNYYKNGVKKSEGKLVDDLFDGEWTFYHEDGSLWQKGNFKNGVKHGLWERYNHQNMVVYKANYEDGNLIDYSRYDQA